MKQYWTKLTRSKWFFIVAILVASLLASIPLLRSGFFHFSDEPHIADLYEMIRAISSGQIPPRWVPDMSYEYGYPLFNFYYVFPFYLGSLVYFFSHSLIFSLKMVFLVSIPLSGIFMYMWLRKHTDTWAALLGSILYIFTPYRAVDLYVRGAIGEALSFTIFPLLLWTINKVFGEKKLRSIGFLGLVTGVLLITHNLSAIMFLPIAVIYAIVLAINSKSFVSLVRAGIGMVLGFFSAAFFVIPAFFEKNLLNPQTPFNYIDHFPFIKQLIYSPFRYGASLPGPNDDISFQVGIINWVLIILSIFMIKKLSKEKRLFYIFIAASVLFTLFLMNIRSNFLWKVFSLSTYIQFPWRLLMLTTFLTSAFVIFFDSVKKYRKELTIGLSALVIAINFSYFKPSGYYYPDDNYFLKRFFARNTTVGMASELSPEYKNYSEDYLLLPLAVQKRPDSLPSAKFTSKDVKIDDIRENSLVSYSATVEGKGTVEFHSYSFPGWYVTVNGISLSTKVLEPHGDIGIEVSGGKSQINVFWRETPPRKASDILSILSAAIILGTIVFNGKKKTN
ncbi:6-pyruvoyl-tetrahydropterin synthase-related protein [Patescibacteria group bacterium]|nr:6-pyruvoyl-tetrahydropterin synthase-related protein [Patescibacteria group bacterium]